MIAIFPRGLESLCFDKPWSNRVHMSYIGKIQAKVLALRSIWGQPVELYLAVPQYSWRASSPDPAKRKG